MVGHDLPCAAGPLSSACYVVGKEKAQGLYLLPHPLSEAFAMPISVEGTTQRPRANMQHHTARHTRIIADEHDYISTKASVAATFLTEIESCEVSDSQERALSNAFHYVIASRPVPISGLRGDMRLQIYAKIYKVRQYRPSNFPENS